MTIRTSHGTNASGVAASRRRGGRRGVAIVAALLGLIFTAGTSTPAHAQSVPDSRVAVDFGGGAQVTTSSFSQFVTFEQYAETGSLTAGYDVGRRPFVELGGTVRLWRHIGAGIAGTYLHDPGSAQVVAQVPNPLVFGQPREINGSVAVAHTEVGLHFQAVYWMQHSERLEIMISGGPSVFHVTQDFVSGVDYTQTFPYTTAAFQDASVVRERKTVVGGTVAGQAGWQMARHFSLVAGIRFTRASASFPDTSASAVAVGGLQISGGVRWRM
jgi:hypothetical protein